MNVFVEGIGLRGAGLADWADAREILRGERPYTPSPMSPPQAELLPPTERRRCGEVVRLALHIGVTALQGSPRRAQALATVFTSASGNGEVIHQICEVLATATREVSPTRFHNSVHNAPAGYWSIATGSRAPSTSLCASQGSFAAGLLEATLQCSNDCEAVLLMAYDMPHPEPLARVSPVIAPFGVALLLAPAMTPQSFASLAVELTSGAVETQLDQPALEALRRGNAAARALPVLQALALGSRAAAVLPYVSERHLSVAAAPCR